MIQDNISRLYQLISKAIKLLEDELESCYNQEKNGFKNPKEVTTIVCKILNVLIQLDKIGGQYNLYNDLNEQDKEIIQQFLTKHKNG